MIILILFVTDLKVVPFGTTSSPYLLQQVLVSHLSTLDNELANNLQKYFYVDNLITTYSDENQLISEKFQIDQLLNLAGMPLRGWI